MSPALVRTTGGHDSHEREAIERVPRRHLLHLVAHDKLWARRAFAPFFDLKGLTKHGQLALATDPHARLRHRAQLAHDPHERQAPRLLRRERASMSVTWMLFSRHQASHPSEHSLQASSASIVRGQDTTLPQRSQRRLIVGSLTRRRGRCRRAPR